MKAQDINLFARVFVERNFYTQATFINKIMHPAKNNVLNFIYVLGTFCHIFYYFDGVADDDGRRFVFGVGELQLAHTALVGLVCLIRSDVAVWHHLESDVFTSSAHTSS